MSKIYTKTGDTGTTSLIGGERVLKCDPRVMAYGKVDELIAHLAVIRSLLPSYPTLDQQPLDDQLAAIQSHLMHIAAQLATPASSTPPANTPSNKNADSQDVETHVLEDAIDRMQEQLPPLRHFVRPAGPLVAAYTHIARTACREAERLMTAPLVLDSATPSLVYINRLSDYLFILARFLCVVTKNNEDFF